MSDFESQLRLPLPSEPSSGHDVLESIASNKDWRVERIMSSAGEVVLDLIHLPSHIHGLVRCHPTTNGLYTFNYSLSKGGTLAYSRS